MEATNLETAATELLVQARAANSGRAALTVYGGHEHALRQTMIALAGGNELAEHASPGEATLHVLAGRIRVGTASGQTWDGSAGDFLIIPPERHSVSAETDAVLLLTVANETA